MPKVSVIMSVYNGIEYFSDAVESILNQTEKDLELIVIDDGSTERVCDSIMYNADPRIRFYREPKNKGLTVRLNQCLDLVKGDFIVRMDADDQSLPTRIEKQIAAFEPGVGFTGCWASSVDVNGKSITHFVDLHCRCTDEDLKTKYPKQLCMVDASTVYSKEVIKKIGYFDKRMYRTQTYNYNLRVLNHFEGRVVQEVLYIRTVRPNSIMNRGRDTNINLMELAQKRALKFPIIKDTP